MIQSAKLSKRPPEEIFAHHVEALVVHTAFDEVAEGG